MNVLSPAEPPRTLSPVSKSATGRQWRASPRPLPSKDREIDGSAVAEAPQFAREPLRFCLRYSGVTVGYYDR
jgi:hypothetical protein